MSIISTLFEKYKKLIIDDACSINDDLSFLKKREIRKNQFLLLIILLYSSKNL